MDTILQIFFSPQRAFGELKEENKFPTMALIIVLLLVAANLILLIPVTSKVAALMLTKTAMQMPEQQMERALDILHKMRYLTAIGGVFTAAFTFFMYALILYIITLVAKPALAYMKVFTIVVYSNIALMLGGLINTGLLYLRGIDTITSPYEIELTGLNVLTTMEQAGGALYVFLSLVNPFQLWFVILLSIGLKVFTEMKYTKALLLCILFWIITVIFPVVSMIFSEMTLKNAGIM